LIIEWREFLPIEKMNESSFLSEIKKYTCVMQKE